MNFGECRVQIGSYKMSVQLCKEDCYFYFYSSCTKGDDCPFRHCQAALGTETVCCLWREGKCFRDNCKFRHMESRINRNLIQCYWEDQPSGCLKPHCVFLHRRPRLITNEGLILPVSNTTPQLSPSGKVAEVNEVVKRNTLSPTAEMYSNKMSVSELSPTSHPVEPIVVSFDGEESDSESASSTPMKSACDSKYNSSPVKKDLLDKFSEKNNLGIKTLEQIKMEKIHKESDNFYKSAYDAPYIDASKVKMVPDISYNTDCYPPQSDFILIPDRPVEKSVCGNTESVQHSPENEGLFKNRLLKRKSVPLYSEGLPLKKMVSLKKNKDDPLDFKIKTLEEIRREKLSKSETHLDNDEISCQSNSQTSPREVEASSLLKSKHESSSNGNIKSFRRLKIKRQPKESLTQTNIAQEADSSTENDIKEDRTQMILHEVQNITEDQNKDVKGKRKDNDMSCEGRMAKQFKVDCSSPSSTTASSTSTDFQRISMVEEKQVNKPTRPIIKRKKLTIVPPSSKPMSECEISSTVAKPDVSTVLPTKENNTYPKEGNCLPSTKDTDKKTPKTSVDELDNFLMNETDVSLDYEPDGNLNEADDILLEIEQLLDS